MTAPSAQRQIDTAAFEMAIRADAKIDSHQEDCSAWRDAVDRRFDRVDSSISHLAGETKAGIAAINATLTALQMTGARADGASETRAAAKLDWREWCGVIAMIVAAVVALLSYFHKI